MDDLVIFGASGFGEKAMPYLEKKYNIVCWLDNNSDKWGKKYKNYFVRNPKELVGFQGKIMITSVWQLEIEEQLISLGFHPCQIYSLSICQTDTGYHYEEYPLNEKFLEPTGKDLQEYDLCDNAEIENGKIKVMLFCTFYSVYTKQLAENMAKRYMDLEFSLITSDSSYKDGVNSGSLNHIYVFHNRRELKTILEQIPVYSAMQLLWIEPEWCYFSRLIRQKSRHLNLNVGGSDFYRADKKTREYKRRLIREADIITAETPETVKDFMEYYGADAEGKMGLLPFGIPVLDEIDALQKSDRNNFRKMFGIPEGKVVVTCGHNGIRFHQHFAIIDAIEALPAYIKEQMIFVFPMTYPNGQEKYIGEVRRALEQTKLDYLILTKYMDLREMAMYALVSDIMIHVQVTDQLSSTMLEEMYAGSLVIAGSWLPYSGLHEEGIYFLDVDAVSDITFLLEEISAHMEEYKKKCVPNRLLVYAHSSWEVLSKRWYKLWA